MTQQIRSQAYRPSIFDRLSEQHPEVSSTPGAGGKKSRAGMPRPLVKPSRGHQRVWIFVFACMTLGVSAQLLLGWVEGRLSKTFTTESVSAADSAPTAVAELPAAITASASTSADASPPFPTVSRSRPRQSIAAITAFPRTDERRRDETRKPDPEPERITSQLPAAERTVAAEPLLADRVASDPPRQGATTLPPPRREPPADRAPTEKRVTPAETTPSASEDGAPASLAETVPEPIRVADPAKDAEPFEPAVKIFSPSPSYPAAAQTAGRSGEVSLEARIDEQGAVAEVRTLAADDDELERAAVEALRRWRFEPARRDGRAVEDVYRTKIRFALAPPSSAPGPYQPPVKLVSPLPSYPASAWAANIRGDVKLKVLVDENGEVGAVEVVEGLSQGLDQAAIAAVRQWKFKPAMRGEEAVQAYEHLTFRFAP